jgi:hypothetical protein
MVMSMISPATTGDMVYGSLNECGGCRKKLKKPLMCSRCKAQKYCSKECQRKDFARHKKCCRPEEDAEIMQDREKM